MPKLVDPSEKRAELVSASWDVIASEGLRAATLRRVAKEAGCTTGSLTHYFADRRSLLVAALRAAHYEAGARMARAVEATGSDLEKLQYVLLEALPMDGVRLREWRVWLAFWAESMHDAELAAENDRRYAEWRALLRDLLLPLVSNAAEAEREVEALVSLIDGLGVHVARNTADEARIRGQQRRTETVLSRYLERFGESLR